jgi:hypothetical protein
MAQLAGFNAQVDINGIAYTVSEYRIDDETPALETTNSEAVLGDGTVDPVGGGYQTNVSGVSQAKVMLKTATFDDTDDVFAAPLSLASAIVVAVSIFPDGRTAGLPHTFPNLRITKVTPEGQINGLQPITIEGVTDGSYSLRNQAGVGRI